MKKILLSFFSLLTLTFILFLSGCEESSSLKGKTFVYYAPYDTIEDSSSRSLSNGFNEYDWIHNNFPSNIDFSVSGMGENGSTVSIPNSIEQNEYGFVSSSMPERKKAFTNTSSIENILSEFRAYANQEFENNKFTQIIIIVPEDYSNELIIKVGSDEHKFVIIADESDEIRIKFKSADYQEYYDTNGMFRGSIGDKGEIYFGGEIEKMEYVNFHIESYYANEWVSENYLERNNTKTDVCCYPSSQTSTTDNYVKANFALNNSVNVNVLGFEYEQWSFDLTVYAAFVDQNKISK